MIRRLMLIAAWCALVSCSKKYPLVGTFSGSAEVKFLRRPSIEKKATVAMSTEERNQGGSQGPAYVLTLDGAPFAKPCKLTELLHADESDPGATIIFPDQGNCTVDLGDKSQVADFGGNAYLKGEVLTVTINGGDVSYHFTGKR